MNANLIGILGLTVVFLFFSPLKGKSKNLTTVNNVDLEKYTGTWFEIAKIPNWFQKQCARNTTATYKRLENGKIRVINTCTTDEGEEDSVTGVAKIADQQSNAKLEVSFVKFLGLQLFWGDYWIIGLDENYNWAIVGTPSRKFGWILSRTPTISDSTLTRINSILENKDYEPDSFEMTPQDSRD